MKTKLRQKESVVSKQPKCQIKITFSTFQLDVYIGDGSLDSVSEWNCKRTSKGTLILKLNTGFYHWNIRRARTQDKIAYPDAADSGDDRIGFADCTLNSVGINQMCPIVRKRCSTCIHIILNWVDNVLKFKRLWYWSIFRKSFIWSGWIDPSMLTNPGWNPN